MIMAIVKLHPERRIGQQFRHDPGEFEDVFLGHGHSEWETARGNRRPMAAPMRPALRKDKENLTPGVGPSLALPS